MKKENLKYTTFLAGACPASSGEDAQKMEGACLAQIILLKMGVASAQIPLNGGSDTRRATREYWREIAEQQGIPFHATGYMVFLERFLIVSDHDALCLLEGRYKRRTV